jgi:ribose-phosphate pyrophosphokinase
MIRINGIPVATEKFPNRETKVKDFSEHIGNNGHAQVNYTYENDDELMSLLFAKKRLDEIVQIKTIQLIGHGVPRNRATFIETLGFGKKTLRNESKDAEDNFDTSMQIQDISDEECLLRFKYYSDKDLVALVNAKAQLDQLGKKVNLFIYYMPYSRMDREIPGDLFTLKYVAELIAKLNFSRVAVMEPHSHKTVGLLREHGVVVKDIYPTKEWIHDIMSERQFTEQDHIVFPDKGARERYSDVDVSGVLTFEKKRNPQTGRLEGFELATGAVNKRSKCIIIDDLCSRGGTFIGVGGVLKQQGAGSVDLLVAHCEDTIFDGEVLKNGSPIDQVYTSGSILTGRHPKIKLIKIREGIYYER